MSTHNQQEADMAPRDPRVRPAGPSARASSGQPRRPPKARARRAARHGLVCGLLACALAALTAPASVTAADAAPSGTGLKAAEATVEAASYTPFVTTGFDPARTLSVIIGMATGSVDGHPQQAFFFHNGHYVGRDTGEPSASEDWVWSTDTTVAIQYQLYRPDDPMCCPTGGASTVRFVWDGTTVRPIDPVPSSAWNAALSRR
jgi:hypothetical protein